MPANMPWPWGRKGVEQNNYVKMVQEEGEPGGTKEKILCKDHQPGQEGEKELSLPSKLLQEAEYITCWGDDSVGKVLSVYEDRSLSPQNIPKAVHA